MAYVSGSRGSSTGSSTFYNCYPEKHSVFNALRRMGSSCSRNHKLFYNLFFNFFFQFCKEVKNTATTATQDHESLVAQGIDWVAVLNFTATRTATLRKENLHCHIHIPVGIDVFRVGNRQVLF